MPLLSTRIFSCSPLTLLVASATVKVPVDPDPAGAAAVVGASVGGDVVGLLDLELLEQAASAIAASTAAVANFMLVERIGTSLSRVPAGTLRSCGRSGSREPRRVVVRKLRVCVDAAGPSSRA